MSNVSNHLARDYITLVVGPQQRQAAVVIEIERTNERTSEWTREREVEGKR